MAPKGKKDEVLAEEIKVLEQEEPKEEVVKKPAKKKTTVKIKAPRVNVRKSPSLMGDVLKIAVAGDKFALVNDGDDGFYEITCDGETAYIMKDYAQLI